MWHDCVRWHLRGICRSGAFEIGQPGQEEMDKSIKVLIRILRADKYPVNNENNIW
jgi:hypothetical protein